METPPVVHHFRAKKPCCRCRFAPSGRTPVVWKCIAWQNQGVEEVKPFGQRLAISTFTQDVENVVQFTEQNEKVFEQYDLFNRWLPNLTYVDYISYFFNIKAPIRNWLQTPGDCVPNNVRCNALIQGLWVVRSAEWCQKHQNSLMP